VLVSSGWLTELDTSVLLGAELIVTATADPVIAVAPMMMLASVDVGKAILTSSHYLT
jgi:hypothetical protein